MTKDIQAAFECIEADLSAVRQSLDRQDAADDRLAQHDAVLSNLLQQRGA